MLPGENQGEVSVRPSAESSVRPSAESGAQSGSEEVAGTAAAGRELRASPRQSQWLRPGEPGRAEETGQSDPFLEEE